jgi:putative phosphoesterase
MKKIGLLSDTHGHLPQKVLQFLVNSDEIWHAGDIGDLSVIDELENITTVRAVYGNIDGRASRLIFKENEIFTIDRIKVYMTHIGGYPGRYNPKALKCIDEHKPAIFISGHSHILKVMPDRKRKLLHINPGAAGNSGFHKSITCMRFLIGRNGINELEILDIPRKQLINKKYPQPGYL